MQKLILRLSYSDEEKSFSFMEFESTSCRKRSSLELNFCYIFLLYFFLIFCFDLIISILKKVILIYFWF